MPKLKFACGHIGTKDTELTAIIKTSDADSNKAIEKLTCCKDCFEDYENEDKILYTMQEAMKWANDKNYW